MKLEDTIVWMESAEYIDQFKAEYHQLKIRIEELRRLLIKWDAGKLESIPVTPRATLLTQKRYMEEYLNTLEVRAEIEDIDLGGD